MYCRTVYTDVKFTILMITYISIASSVDENYLIHRSLVCELHDDVRTYIADMVIKSLVS